LDYIGIKINELVPSLLFGKTYQEYYLTKLVGEMVKAKHDGFLKAVILAGGNTQMRFLAHLLLLIIITRCLKEISATTKQIVFDAVA